jgi:hypothetical protein
MNKVSRGFHAVGEMVGDFTRTVFTVPPWFSSSAIRNFVGFIGTRFWPTSHPAAENSIVNYELTRSMYRNDGSLALGTGFAKPIVNVVVNFMGMPRAQIDSEVQTEFLNECLQDYWAPQLREMFTAALRDSKAVVKLCWPDIFDPLMTLDEAEHGFLEIIPADLIDIEKDARNKNITSRVVIHRKMNFILEDGDPESGKDPTIEQHNVLEIIDRERYRFFDQTDQRWLEELDAPNHRGFVPIVEAFNEWDSALQGGQSDLETSIPFMTAFHEVLVQGLQAHKYHSTPKLKLKLADVGTFIKNNFHEAWDEASGTIKNGSAVALNGREVYLFQSEEDAAFLEAKSVLGDTKTLLEFLIDCICISSETPEWALMRVDSGSANSDRNAQTVPLIKKVERKRTNFQDPIQQLCKMILVSIGSLPVRVPISWDIVRPDDEFVTMQAFQQLVMGLEVARSRGEISDETYRKAIKEFLPQMKTPSQEEKDIPAIDPLALPALPAPGQTAGGAVQ